MTLLSNSALRLWLTLAVVCTVICGFFSALIVLGLFLNLGGWFEFSGSLVRLIGVVFLVTWVLGLVIATAATVMYALAEPVYSDDARLLRRLRSTPRVVRRQRGTNSGG
jgi:hypothetical protein